MEHASELKLFNAFAYSSDVIFYGLQGFVVVIASSEVKQFLAIV